MRLRGPAGERFRKLFAISNIKNGCVEWAGNRAPNGYGRIYDGKKMVMAHRFSYELHKGKVDPGLFVCHSCDNPPCVNPDHLFLGSPKDNVHDMIRKMRNNIGEKNGEAVLTEGKVRKIRELHRSGVSARKIAAKFRLDYSNTCYVIRRDTWKHIK